MKWGVRVPIYRVEPGIDTYSILPRPGYWDQTGMDHRLGFTLEPRV